MYLYIIPSVTIHDDTFTQCYCTSRGGAVYIQSCLTEDDSFKVFDNCRFLKCQGDSDAGGGMFAYYNKHYNSFLTNTLFSECSNRGGRALYLCYSSS